MSTIDPAKRPIGSSDEGSSEENPTKRARLEDPAAAVAAAATTTVPVFVAPCTTTSLQAASTAAAPLTLTTSPATAMMTTTELAASAPPNSHTTSSAETAKAFLLPMSRYNLKLDHPRTLKHHCPRQILTLFLPSLTERQQLLADLRAKDQERRTELQERRTELLELRRAHEQLLEKDRQLLENQRDQAQQLLKNERDKVQKLLVDRVRFLSEIGSSTNATFVARFVTEDPNPTLRTNLRDLRLPPLDRNALHQKLEDVRSDASRTGHETDMHWAVANYCQAVCEQVGAQLNFHANSSTKSADVIATTWAVDRVSPRASRAASAGSRVDVLLYYSRLFVEVKKVFADVQHARLQVASYVARSLFRTGVPATSWPDFLYGLTWCEADTVSVTRVDLKQNGKLIAPKVTFAETEDPARAVLFVVWQSILAHHAAAKTNAPSNSDDPNSWTCNFGCTDPRAGNPGAAAPGQPNNAAGGGAPAGAGGNVVTTNSLVLNLTTGPQPLLDAQVFHRDFMFTGKLRLNSSEEFTNVVVKVAAANRKSLTEQLAREGMALALLNRDRKEAAAHGIPELLSFCTVNLDGTPGLALVTGLISGHSVDWMQHQPYAANFASQVCDTLRWIHAQGVVHGDIHCGNLLVTETQLPSSIPQQQETPTSTLVPPKSPHLSIALVDFGLSCFLPAVTREHVQAALLAAPVTVAAAQELQPWLGHVEANSWSVWPSHFYHIARSDRVATPQADFLSLGLLAFSLEIGGTRVLEQRAHLDDSDDAVARAQRRHFLRNQRHLQSLLEKPTATLTEVQKIVALADDDVPTPPALV
ncbi:hypothetical protein CAOG_07343 [Capsaspora owczarzaki ATCC 30864]|uniref:Protein kinase domain-containing protein n=1 Tax=Capsaspora owczarzaki (strain ATCC 30864) TaxID=595528 RepID=A0A0D2X5B0_CAPO3|nr:hypothetical protein CAOG_07343 [Capsaspora owczarzaki ATCC 30864]KJE97494.1 hypothetical protein CAOG_007343 [Capsaspora owczarzaki ATCC 30864]|eukprot:XP_004343202.1 hypothetical protein CAOG_07343 [Capsaspora owczarzaki ATCC 30864]